MNFFGNTSLKDYSTDYLVTGVAGFLTIMGSLGFIVWNDIFERFKEKFENKLSLKKTWLMFSLHTKLVLTMLVIMIVFGCLGTMLFEFNNPNTLGEYNVFDKIWVSTFHGISARTTGFAAIDLMNMTRAGKFLTIILMMIGGAPGSTAGGLKTVTLAVLVLTALNSISGNKYVNVYKREIRNDTIKQAIAVLMTALLIVSTISMVLSVLNPEVEFINILFETVSALATCGYSLGITSSLTMTSKIILIVTMYIGRVSTVTMTMALAGKRFKQDSVLNYPKADVSL